MLELSAFTIRSSMTTSSEMHVGDLERSIVIKALVCWHTASQWPPAFLGIKEAGPQSKQRTCAGNVFGQPWDKVSNSAVGS